MDICLLTEKDIISNDCNTMRALGLNIHDSIFSMMIVPFYAISIRSIEEYEKIELLDTECDRIIYDLRNSIKVYQDKYRKIRIRFLESDESSDELFKNQLRFKFLKKWNIHYNIGIYVTKDGKIIGNTQWIESYFRINKEPDDGKNKKSYNTGYMMGCAIQKACNTIESYEKSKDIQLGIIPTYGYIDFNTNRALRIFRGSWDKDVQLALLHILTLINFEKYVLEKVLPCNNEWLFRMKYIVTHYAVSGMEQIFRHCNADDKMESELKEKFHKMLDDRWTLFSSDFRGCMMHYRLRDKEDKSLIKEELFDESVPFKGLIESIFPGMTFEKYDKSISIKTDEIEMFLESQFDVDKRMIKDE